MAKADDTTSTSDWIWLRDALALAVAAFGSVAGAKEQLTEWLAAGKLPWACTPWKALDAEGIAKLHQSFRASDSFAPRPVRRVLPRRPPVLGRELPQDRLGRQQRRARR